MADYDPQRQSITLEGDEAESSDLIEALRTAWDVVPPDEDALWARIGPRLGEQAAPGRSWLLALLTNGLASTPRVMALGGAAAALALGMVVVSSALRGGDTASADVLRAAERLSTTARVALDDSSLTSDEATAIREQAAKLAQLLSGDRAALSDLHSSDLDRLEAELSNVLIGFDELSEGDEREVEDARFSVFEAHDAFEGERDRRGRGGGDDEHQQDRTPTPQASAGVGADDLDASKTPPPASPVRSASTATVAAATPTPSAASKPGGEGEEHGDGASAPPPTVAAGAATSAPTSTSTPASTATATASATPAAGGSGSATIPGTAGTYTWSVGSAGTVAFTFDGHETFQVTNVSAATGWMASVQEADGSELRVRFSMAGQTTTFEASRENGSIEIAVSGGGGG